MALTAGVRELKNRLTHYLRLVRQGERVVVTDRNEPIAVLAPLSGEGEALSEEERLASLAKQGALRLGDSSKRLRRWKGVPSTGETAADRISEDRDSRG